jgi:hypothetical protein
MFDCIKTAGRHWLTGGEIFRGIDHDEPLNLDFGLVAGLLGKE